MFTLMQLEFERQLFARHPPPGNGLSNTCMGLLSSILGARPEMAGVSTCPKTKRGGVQGKKALAGNGSGRGSPRLALGGPQ